MKTRSDAFQFEKELDWDKPAPGIRRQIMGLSLIHISEPTRPY